jgi:hypothetical protein
MSLFCELKSVILSEPYPGPREKKKKKEKSGSSIRFPDGVSGVIPHRYWSSIMDTAICNHKRQ